jgi:hypothetical protein
MDSVLRGGAWHFTDSAFLHKKTAGVPGGFF